MSLEADICSLAAKGTLEALNKHLPGLLERLTLPPDLNHRHTLAEAAVRLRLPKATVEARVKAGELRAVRDGKYVFVLEEDLAGYNRRLRDREKFKRDQSAPLTNDVPAHITAMLEPKPERTGR